MVNSILARLRVTVLCLLSISTSVQSAVPYAEYILAPSSRTLYPSAVYHVNGTVTGADSLTQPSGDASFQGVSAVTFDFLKNIAGFVTVVAGNSSSPDAAIGLAYSESSEWISGESSDGTQNGVDELIWLPVGQGPGTYTVDKDHERGGFRYLSLISNTSDTIDVQSVSVNFTAAPSQDLQAYAGYFHCNDELINRIWYAGAYTCQLCSIDPQRGNAVINFPPGQSRPGEVSLDHWYFNTTISNGTSVLTDGAKRDRLVWPGDMAVSIPTVFVSTNDMESLRNSLDSLFVLQTSDGMLPYAGTPLPSTASWTYHLHNLIGAYNYYIFSGDADYLNGVWDQFKRGVAWSLSSIDDTGLMNVGASADWLRSGMGGHNIEANAILYYVLHLGLELAAIQNDTSVVDEWTSRASGVKDAANKLLWDSSASLYKDNETTTLYPQDGNVWAIKSNLTTSDAQQQSISEALHGRWGKYGAPAPEAGAIVSPFISSFELEAHLLAGQGQYALDLMRVQWGFMLDDPRTTNSTLNEGYSTDGSLHYVYGNDQRLSHAHGWSTGPTGTLSFYVAGLHLESASGATWRLAPQPGDLTDVAAGFATKLGAWSVKLGATDNVVQSLDFATPEGTTGDVDLPGTKGKLVSDGGEEVPLDDNGSATGVKGGNWTLKTS